MHHSSFDPGNQKNFSASTPYRGTEPSSREIHVSGFVWRYPSGSDEKTQGLDCARARVTGREFDKKARFFCLTYGLLCSKMEI
jgi:hypothetical protein